MASRKESRRLRVGVLGCGPIAQIAHFDACAKARNIELYAVCDVADDLRSRMTAIWEPTAEFASYDAMLVDDRLEAVIVAVADQFHVPLALQALNAGKHVFVEKPMGTTVEECRELRQAARRCGRVLQVGFNRRFDPAMAFAKRFVDEELGPWTVLRAWYHDSAFRYTMTDNLQPIVRESRSQRRPLENLKADRQRYYLLTHGSHLVDWARFLCGEIRSVRAQLLQRDGCYAWIIVANFEGGGVGTLHLIVAVQGDYEEGFALYGQGGSLRGRLHLPWYHKAGEVECFSAHDRVYRRPLGDDAHTYKLQLEDFARCCLGEAPQHGANADDGLACAQSLAAIARSAATNEEVNVLDVTGGV
jgi:predicted dehydrogenase